MPSEEGLKEWATVPRFLKSRCRGRKMGSEKAWAAPAAQASRKIKPNPSLWTARYSLFADIKSSLCSVCGFETQNAATTEITIGIQDVPLRVCRHCYRDFELLEVRINQVIALKTKLMPLEPSDSMEHLVMEALSR